MSSQQYNEGQTIELYRKYMDMGVIPVYPSELVYQLATSTPIDYWLYAKSFEDGQWHLSVTYRPSLEKSKLHKVKDGAARRFAELTVNLKPGPLYAWEYEDGAYSANIAIMDIGAYSANIAIMDMG